MSEDVEPGSHRSTPVVKSTTVIRRFVIYGGVLLVVFLLGFVPMWLKARECGSSLAGAEQQLRLARIKNILAPPVMPPRGGITNPPRQAASQFFTSLRAEIDKGDTSD